MEEIEVFESDSSFVLKGQVGKWHRQNRGKIKIIERHFTVCDITGEPYFFYCVTFERNDDDASQIDLNAIAALQERQAEHA